MKKIQDAAAGFFIFAVIILSVVSILGVWDFFDRDVIMKSFQTIGLLALVAVIVVVAGRYLEGKTAANVALPPAVPNPAFKAIRQMTLTVLIFAASVLALLGVLAIWDVITDKDVLYKAIGSVGIIAFSALVIVIVCLDRENNPLLYKGGKGISVGSVLLVLFLMWLLFSVFGGLL